jgi:hypothetical protein
MSLRRKAKKNGDYPEDAVGIIRKNSEIRTESKIYQLVTYETDKSINLYLGGKQRWCMHVELIKDNGIIKPMGYLIKARYDSVCSDDFQHRDTNPFIKVFIQYLHHNYPTLKTLSFNDISTKACDHGVDVNLAVMSYLYSGKTWYEKSFDAYLSPQSEGEMERIKERYDSSKKIPWNEMSSTIHAMPPLTEEVLEQKYNDSTTWLEFFKGIHKEIGISQFCKWITPWIYPFILNHFNNLMSLTYLLPIKDRGIPFEEIKSIQGGKRLYLTRVARRRRTMRI